MQQPGCVQFNFTVWAARYPELAAAGNATLAASYFAEATLYLNNGPFSPVCDLDQRAVLLNMLTAHIAKLYEMRNGEESSPLVGRITDATEGSVSVSADMPDQPQSAAWYQQTKYGASFWAATAQYRVAQYIPPPRARGFTGPRRW